MVIGFVGVATATQQLIGSFGFKVIDSRIMRGTTQFLGRVVGNSGNQKRDNGERKGLQNSPLPRKNKYLYGRLGESTTGADFIALLGCKESFVLTTT